MPKLSLLSLGLLGSSLLFGAERAAQTGRAATPVIPADQLVSPVPAEKIPSAAPRSPEEALQSFKLAPGIRLELAATEPLVQDPVAVTFGPDGRMWVVEMRGYMKELDGRGEELPVGRVSVLSDSDGDGRYDEGKVFVDGLVMPRAIALVADGVLVGAPPELAFWRDTDGDGRADEKTVVATDYGVKDEPTRRGVANVENAPNALLRAHDNWIYSAAYAKKIRYVNGRWELVPSPLRGQWGLGQDDYGRLYFNSNSIPIRVAVIHPAYAARNPNYPDLAGTNLSAAVDNILWPARVTPSANRAYMPGILRPDGTLQRFTAAAVPWVYRGDLLPQFRGDVFIGEPGGNLVRREVLATAKGTVQGRNAYDRAEFIASVDERFRPVNFTTGPDGALYVVDLYRGLLQHHLSLSHYLRKQALERNLAHPQHLGRIYRVVPADRPAPRASRLPALTPAQWVERLAHPNSWWRETAQRILVERRDADVLPALRRMALTGEQPLGRMHALWTLEGVDALDRAILLKSLDDRDPLVRVAAIRLTEPLVQKGDRGEFVPRLLQLAEGGVPEVQLQAVLSLGVVDNAGLKRNLANIARGSPDNTFLPEAFFSGIAHRELELLEFALGEARWAPEDKSANRIISGLAQGVFSSRNLAAIERMLGLAADQLPAARPRTAAILTGISAAAGKSKRGPRLPREPAGWEKLAQDSALAPQIEKLATVVAWPGKAGVPDLEPVAPLTAAQQIQFEKGREHFIAICAACHQPTGRGLEGLAPPLLDSEWLLGSPGPVVRIVLHGKLGQTSKVGLAHMGDMPPFGALADDQIAALLTYLRREWGHPASPIDPSEVRSIRAATSGRAAGWSVVELNALR